MRRPLDEPDYAGLDPARRRALIAHHQMQVIYEPRSQLQFAQENGLVGVEWRVSAPEIAQAFQDLARRHSLPQEFPGLDLGFVVARIR